MTLPTTWRTSCLPATAAASPPHRHWLVGAGLALVLLGGAVLRFWNLTAGLPYRIGVDEPVLADLAVRIMKSGDFNPHFFEYPGLYFYMQVAVGSVRFVTGAIDGLWRSVNEFRPEHLYLWTRALNAGLGTVTILIVYRAGLRWGSAAALLAAGLMAVWPNHVRESHFALTDVPLTLLTTLALVLSLRARETGRLALFLAAGASVGLAAATKYSGASALSMPLLAAAVARAPRSVRAWGMVAATGGAAGAFLIGAPYTVLDLPAFLNSFGALAVAYRPRPFGSGAQVYLGHLTTAIGLTGVIVAGAGVLWSLKRAVRDDEVGKWVVLAGFPLIYFPMIATKNLVFARYLLPILPPLCLFVAVVVVDVVAWIVRLKQPLGVRVLAASAFAGVVLFHPVREGIDWPRQYGRRTTQDVAYGMIQQFIPRQSGVAIERAALRLPDSAYRTAYVDSLTQRSAEEYVASGVTFLIASSDAFGPVFADPDRHRDVYEAYQRLLDNEGRQCLPTVTPTAAVSGPQIRICRLGPR